MNKNNRLQARRICPCHLRSLVLGNCPSVGRYHHRCRRRVHSADPFLKCDNSRAAPSVARAWKSYPVMLGCCPQMRTSRGLAHASCREGGYLSAWTGQVSDSQPVGDFERSRLEWHCRGIEEPSRRGLARLPSREHRDLACCTQQRRSLGDLSGAERFTRKRANPCAAWNAMASSRRCWAKLSSHHRSAP